MWSEDDIRFMHEAHNLAKLAEGRTTPDPMVGAVIVKDGKSIAMGYHGEVATPHAEAWAIQKAEADCRGATLYVNLEPCSHYGNNPPCVKAIIDAGIKEVVCSMKDPNPLVNGKGFQILKRQGVKVRIGLLEKEALILNEVFVKYITTNIPFIVLKAAMTLDGKIATYTGASRWVAGEESREHAHHLRNVYDAILVGYNNVIVDNPKLTVRNVKKIKNPIRIVVDSLAQTPLKAAVISREARTIIATTAAAPAKRVHALQNKGAEVLTIKAMKNGWVDLKALMKALGKMKITSVLLEGGGEVHGSAVEARLPDKAYIYIAPKIFGGREAKTPVEGQGVKLPAQAQWLHDIQVNRLGEDILVSGYF